MSHRNKRPDTKRRAYRPPASRQRNTGDPLTDANDCSSPLEIALNRAMLLLPSERTAILAPVHAGFEAFRAGAGTVEHWAQLADAINVGAVLSKRNIASNHQDTFAAGTDALRAVHDRHAVTSSWTLRGPEIAALELAVFVHKVQLDQCSRGELAAAVQTVIHRVQAALRGQVAPGTTVCLPGHPSQHQAARPAAAAAA
jgi:hypothetical protein